MAARDAPDDPFARVTAAVFDRADPNSLTSIVESVRQVASVVRDLISLDMWRVINTLGELPGRADAGDDGPTPADVLDLLNRTVMTLAAFGGLAVGEHDPRGGVAVPDMGRKLERSLHIIGAAARDAGRRPRRTKGRCSTRCWRWWTAG